MEIGSVLRAERARRGEALRALAQRVGVDPAYLSRVESGKTRASRALLCSLAGALGLPEERLLALGGFLPDTWREAAERGLGPGGGWTADGNGETAARVAEPGVQLASESTLARLEGLSDPLVGLLPTGYLASPEINEVYELKLALLEAKLLDRRAVLERSAYFLAIDGKPTRHFRLCAGSGVQLPRDSGTRLRSFLATHRFKTSYATHGLFPYRGKFHPQMVKALLNVMGLKPGEVVLDPMAGSGTTSVEAALMGIDSVAVDASPFCAFLARTKVVALAADLEPLRPIVGDSAALVRTFRALSSEEGMRRVRDEDYVPKGMSRAAFELLALAFLDARGYAERSGRKSAERFFADVLGKYLATVERFQRVWAEIGAPLATARVLEGDARRLDLADGSVDGVLFSPPYSFAVDYLANDASHLAYLGVDTAALRSRMIGLNGRGRAEQVGAYFADMRRVLGEVARVLKPARVCTVVVGSNSRQLGAAMGSDAAAPEVRYGLEARLIEIGEECGLHLELSIRRLIVGIANSMREEHIVMLRKAG
ncbi:MAG: helix-turn-helix domain-containing protein [Thermoanaerobaculales bacterium]